MKRCAFLTLVDTAGYVIDDELACEPLRALGWRVEAVPWRQPGVSWGRFDAVVIRSPWDYQKIPWRSSRCSGTSSSGTPLFHTVLKSPQAADFRVQEEHGGHIRPVEADAALLAAIEAVMEALGERPLYARVDLVRSNDDDEFWLMELELIEPSLYLRLEPEAPGRFARALHGRIVSGTPGTPER